MMLSSGIKKVTVAGITGAVGPSIIRSLDVAGFRVQALTRRRQAAFIPPAINVIEVDYNNSDALRQVLRGQHAVISCLGDVPDAVRAQESLLQASLAVGVKRFIPSEFGSDTTNERIMSYPFFSPKVQHQQRLRVAANIYKDFSYTILITGPFLDWGLSVVPFIINVGARSAQVFDGGDVPFSFTRTSAVGDAVAAVLDRPRETRNRAVFVHEGVTTQNQLIACGERLLSLTDSQLESSHTFSTTNFNSSAAEKAAWEAFNRSDADPSEWILPFINLSIWSDDAPCRFVNPDNELLGIRELEDAELDAVLCEEMERAAKGFGLVRDYSRSEALEAETRALQALDAGKGSLCDCAYTHSFMEQACEIPLE